MSEIKKIKILNLVGDLPVSLASYFDQDKFHLLDRGVLDNYETLNYILVTNLAEAKDVSIDYACEKNEIQVICLGEIRDVREFLLANGRFFMDKDFAANEVGQSILNKFFFDEHNIHLADSFEKAFEKTTEFAITNHLSIGANIDQLSHEAFANGFNLVSLRTFMDHMVYYLTYLKQAGLAGIPFEFEYGHNDDFFAINVQTSVKNFVAEYLLDSFGDVNSEDPLSFLLGIINRSCDYLDITSLENPSKIIFNAIWKKNTTPTSLKGLGFHNILTTAQVIAQVEKQLANFTPEEDKQQELNQRAQELANENLPGGLVEIKNKLEVNSVLNEKGPEQVSEVVNQLTEAFNIAFPDMSLPNITMEDLEHLMMNHPDQDLMKSLSEADKKHLLEKLQKKEMIEAYEAEVARTKERLEEEGSLQEQVADAVSDDLTNQLMQNVDLGVLEGLMGDLDVARAQQLAASQEQAQNQTPGAFDQAQVSGAAGVFDQMQAANDPFAQNAEFGVTDMPTLDGGDPFATAAQATTQAAEGIDPNSLEGMPGLGMMGGMGMPDADLMGGDDPFATGDFNPELSPEENIAKHKDAKESEVLANMAGMPAATNDDPFATEDFAGGGAVAAVDPVTGQAIDPLTGKPKVQQGQQGQQKQIPLPPGVQVMTNPVTGEPMHIMPDPQTGLPIPVIIDPVTGEAKPITPQSPQAASIATDQQAAETFNLGEGLEAMQQLPGAGAPQGPTPMIDSNELGALNGLPSMGGMGMPDAELMGGDDPFATGETDPFATGEFDGSNQPEGAQAQQAPLPPGVQTIVDPKTGQPIHIMMDPNTGLPIPVQIDPATGQATPIAPPAAQTADGKTQMPEQAKPNGQVNPKTGQPIMTMVDPKTGKEIHVSMDPNTGQPVQINPVTGEPIAVAINQTINREAGGPGQVNESNIVNQQVNVQMGEGAQGGNVPNINWNIGQDNIHVHIDPATGQPVAIDPATGQPVDPSQRVGAMPTLDEDLINFDPNKKENPGSFTAHGSPDEEFSQRVGGDEKPEGEFTQTVFGTPEDEDFAQFVDGGLPDDIDPMQFINSMGIEDKAEPTLIFGGDPDDPNDIVSIIKGGQDEAENFKAIISGANEEDKSPLFTMVSDSLVDNDANTKFVVSGSPEETSKNIESMVVKNLNSEKMKDVDPAVKGFIRENAPEEINKGLQNFATQKGVKPEQLTQQQMQEFKQKEVPQIMQRVMGNNQKVEEFTARIAGAPAVKPSEMAKDKRVVKAHMDQVKDSPFNQRQQLVKDRQKQVPQNVNNITGAEGVPAATLQGKSEQDFEAQFRAKFQGKMAEMQKKMALLQKEAGAAKAEANKLKNQKPEQKEVQKVLHETMKESVKEALGDTKNMTVEQRQQKEAEVVKGISKTLKLPEEQVKTIVKEVNEKAVETEKKIVQEKMQLNKDDKKVIEDKNEKDSPFQATLKNNEKTPEGAGPNTMAQTAMMAKLKKMEEENKKLKESMNAMKLKKDASKETDDKVQKVKELSKVDDKDIDSKETKKEIKIDLPKPANDIKEEERKALQEKVNEGKKLTDDEKQKMAVLFDSSENNIKEIQKEAERQIKKLMLEQEQQEILFKGEIEKAAKAVKAKELVLEKAKETMKTVVSKKEQEVGLLKSQVNNLSQKLKDDKSTVLESEVKALKKDKENLMKMSEIYKGKLETMAKSLTENKKEDNTAQINEENRNLKRVKTTLEKQVNEYDKKLQKLESAKQKDLDKDNKVRSELSRTKSEKQKLDMQLKTLKDQQKTMLKKMQQLTKGKEDQSNKELDHQKQINNKLQTRIREMQLKLKNTDQEVKIIDEKQIEKQVTQKFENKIKTATKELSMQKNQNKQLQAKIKELSDKLQGGGAGAGKDGKKGPAGSPKEKRLEANVKKLNSELTKSKQEAVEQKKEVMKAKKEATALKNKMAAMQRELDKAKKAAGNKKKAA